MQALMPIKNLNLYECMKWHRRPALEEVWDAPRFTSLWHLSVSLETSFWSSTWWPRGERHHRLHVGSGTDGFLKAIGLQLADTARGFCKLSYSGMWADGLKWEWNYWSAGWEWCTWTIFGGRGEFAAVENIMLRDVVELFKINSILAAKQKGRRVSWPPCFTSRNTFSFAPLVLMWDDCSHRTQTWASKLNKSKSAEAVFNSITLFLLHFVSIIRSLINWIGIAPNAAPDRLRVRRFSQWQTCKQAAVKADDCTRLNATASSGPQAFPGASALPALHMWLLTADIKRLMLN